MQKVISIGDKFVDLTPSQVFKTFFKEDWDTLVVSSIVLFLNVIFHFIVMNYKITAITESVYFYPGSFAGSLFFGYAGQRMIYKYFGSAEKVYEQAIAPARVVYEQALASAWVAILLRN